MDYTFSLPARKHLLSFREQLATLLSDMSAFTQNVNSSATQSRSRRLKINFNKKKIGTILLVLIIAAALIVGLRIALRKGVVAGTQTTASASATDDTQTVAVNREFSIAAYDENKKLSSPIKYILTDAQLTNEIIIKGQKAKAVTGRSFLIINLKLINETNKSLFLNTRNYVRVQASGTQDKLAPEIHNDTVEVQPQSTKLTRIGLPVDDNQKEFVLFVGEIDGAKQEIPIKF